MAGDAGAGLDAGDELAEVGLVLWKHHDILYQTFAWYATGAGEPYGWSANAFMSFCDECKLVDSKSKLCTHGHLSQLYILVNAPDAAEREAHHKAKNDSRKRGGSVVVADINKVRSGKNVLNREEFIQILVRVAILRYVIPKKVPDASSAVEAMIERDILPRIPRQAVVQSNDFREEHCYHEAVDIVLRRHEKSLRALFGAACDPVGHGGPTSKLERKVMSFEEWMDFVFALDLIDDEFTIRDATTCFVNARMRVIDEYAKGSMIKVKNLSFEDFLEALVRVATMKALPTEEEVADAGCDDAGGFFLKLKAAFKYDSFVRQNPQEWDQPLRQPIHKCVDALITIIIRHIEDETRGEDNLSLTEAEARAYLRVRGVGEGAAGKRKSRAGVAGR